MKLSNNMKNAIVVLIVLLFALSVYLTVYGPKPAVLEKGAEINQETFLELLGDASTIYIVMDIRGASNEIVSTNILQCGVDFAGSRALGGRNVMYVSMDDGECFVGDAVNGGNSVSSVNECIEMLGNGISLYIHEGDGTKYYTKAADIGVGEYYQVGTCAITAG